MIPAFISDTMRALMASGYECYIAGGAVRDTLRGVPVHDYDLTTSALPSETVKVLEKEGYKNIIDSSSRYGTVVFIDPADHTHRVEITTFRSDSDYSDMRHPDKVTFSTSWEDDAKRRDFTVNALYMDVDGGIKDPVGGEADIKVGIIRAVGDPAARFREDALRILRAIRFQARTGFVIDPDTSSAMENCASLLKSISAERVYSELTGILTSPGGPSAIRDNINVLSVIIPELKVMEGFDQRSKYHDRDLLTHTLDTLDGIPLDETGVKDTALAYAALLHDIGKPAVFTVDEDGIGHMKKHALEGEKIAERLASELKFSNELRDEVTELVLLHDNFPFPERRSVKRFMSKMDKAFCDKLLILQRADILAHSELGRKRLELLNQIISIRDQLIMEQPCLTIHDLSVNGDDLIAIGVREGPIIGIILKQVLNLVIDERLNNDKETIINYIKSEYQL